MTDPALGNRPFVASRGAAGLCLVLLLASGCGRDPAGAASPAPAGVSTAGGSSTAVADCCLKEAEVPPAPVVAAHPALPDVPLRNHRGEPVHFYRDLVRGKVVALNFIFTTCQGVCPPLGVNFAALSRRLRDRLGGELELISVSVDPVNDTPERLAAWARRFDPDPRWTLVTGEKRDVDQLLKALGVYSADKTRHTSSILLGDEGAGTWSLLEGLTPPDRLCEAIDALLSRRAQTRAQAQAPENPEAHRYFTDVVLTSHRGEKLRLYSDLMRGKVVVVQAFFCSCTAACPELLSKFMKIQERFRDRMGKELLLLSISVDPTRDTEEKIAAFAQRNGAGLGWYFLTGPKEDVELALRKFGQSAETPDGHSNLFMIGNDRTGLWKKAQGLAAPEALIDVVASVLDDPGTESQDRPVGEQR
jgi:protein SCO1/2